MVKRGAGSGAGGGFPKTDDDYMRLFERMLTLQGKQRRSSLNPKSVHWDRSVTSQKMIDAKENKGGKKEEKEDKGDKGEKEQKELASSAESGSQPMNIVFQIKDIQDLCNDRLMRKYKKQSKKHRKRAKGGGGDDDNDEFADFIDDENASVQPSDDTYDEEEEEDEEENEDSEEEDSEEEDSEEEDSEDEDSEEEDSEDEDSEEEDSEEEDSEDDEESEEDGRGITKRRSSERLRVGKKGAAKRRKMEKEMALKAHGENKDVLNKFHDLSAELLKNNKGNKVAKYMMRMTKSKQRANNHLIRKREKKRKERNMRKFRELVKEKSATKDSVYFKDKMTVEDQESMLVKMGDVSKIVKIDRPFRIMLYDLDIPNEFKAIAIKKINMLKYMDWGSGEYYKIKTWVDTFMRIPFNRYNNLDVKKEDGFENCSDFMHKAKEHLDATVYGLSDAKMQVLQLIGQWITNPNAVGTAIAIKGPMGSGKTTLIKNGISKILGREFAFIALGGATDGAFLEGHSITYEGSTWGKIVDILIQCRSMNPVIYFDELDKISDSPRGEEITGILTHLTDVTQNDRFHDKFFSEIDFDLSKCLFIFSYNDEAKVNPILRDRMYRISTKGYDKNDKCKIANDYLLPKIREQLHFKDGDVLMANEVLHHIIDNHTQQEEGVRNLKRCLEIIHTKINLYMMLKPDTKLYEDNVTLQITLPYTVTTDIVEKLVKKEQMSGSPFGMYL